MRRGVCRGEVGVVWMDKARRCSRDPLKPLAMQWVLKSLKSLESLQFSGVQRWSVLVTTEAGAVEPA